jgi:hypothetical protein
MFGIPAENDEKKIKKICPKLLLFFFYAFNYFNIFNSLLFH